MRHGYGEWRENVQVVTRKERSNKKNRSDRMRKFDKRMKERVMKEREEMRLKQEGNNE